MNERIKELNLQAMSIVMNGNDPDGDVEQMYIPSEFTKKFAELIVQECAKYVDVMWPHQKEFKGTLDVGKGLKAKFGVEE